MSIGSCGGIGMMPNERKAVLLIGDGIMILINLYCFFVPSVLTHGGFSLSVDGVVVERTMCLLSALFYVMKLLEHFASSR